MSSGTAAEFHRPFEGVDYTWRRRVLRRLLRTFVFTTVVKVEVEGEAYIPPTGGSIFIVNHTAFVEPVAVAGVVNREDLVPFSKVENFKIPGISWFVRNWGSMSVRRGQVDRKALSYAVDLLKAGNAILMAPEGTRRPKLKRAHDGMAYMAFRSGALVVPVGVDGGDRFKGNVRQIKRTTLKVRFGPPFYLRLPDGEDHDPEKPLPRKVVKTMTAEAMYQLARLLPERLRGVYGDLENATTEFLAFEDLVYA